MSVSIITTVTVPAAATPPAGAYDLTDLATVHVELKIATGDTANDLWLSRAITQVSQSIVNYVKQPFQIEGLQDLCYIQQDPYPYQTPGGVAPLQLSRWPLAGIVTLTTGANVAAGATVLPFASTAGVALGQPVSGFNLPNGPLTTVAGLVPNTNVTLSQPTAGGIPAGTPMTFGLALLQTIAGAVGAAGTTTQLLLPGQDYAIDMHRTAS